MMRSQKLVTPLILHALKYFDAAARHLSFTRAAAELHVTQGAISQQIKGLEEQVGVRLFVRLTRSLKLTKEGNELHRVVNRLLQELELQLQSIQPSLGLKSVAIRSSPSFSMMWLMPRLSHFGRLYPEIEIHLRGELFGMSALKMSAESIDILVLYGQGPDHSNHYVTRLMSEYLVPVTNSEYFSQYPAIQQASDLTQHMLLHDDSPWENAPPYAEWGEWVRIATQCADDDVQDFIRHGHQYNLSHLAINAATYGQGVAMARTSLVLDDLAQHRLNPAVPICVQTSAAYFLVLNEHASNKRSVNIFKEWMIEECREFEKKRNDFLSAITRMVSHSS